MNIIIPYEDWHIKLVEAIETSLPKTTIIVYDKSMLELARSAHARMCPEKLLYFKLNIKE